MQAQVLRHAERVNASVTPCAQCTRSTLASKHASTFPASITDSGGRTRRRRRYGVTEGGYYVYVCVVTNPPEEQQHGNA